MRLWAKIVLATGVAVAILGYAELVLDIRTPRSAAFQKSALGVLLCRS
jgi:hypothetical protein